tara:strand:+ start:459 stop:629 length:171 start_codon:yes stop_codon:yes gene_type:complete
LPKTSKNGKLNIKESKKHKLKVKKLLILPITVLLFFIFFPVFADDYQDSPFGFHPA